MAWSREELRAAGEKRAIEDARAQGLPERITDPGVLGRVAMMLRSGKTAFRPLASGKPRGRARTRERRESQERS